MKPYNHSGGILIMMVITVMMVTVMFTSIGGVTNLQYHEGALVAQDETAFQIAEAGLNYARWRLAHEPDNFDPVTQDIQDPLKGSLGTYTLTFTAPLPGSTIVTIVSVGHTANSPTREVTLEATYGKPSLTRYATLVNDDVWFTGTISGAVHANGGIRMDGQSDGPVTSAKETYVCQQRHGCSNVTKPGVWGVGIDSSLWNFPVPSVNYGAITVSLLDMQEAAIAAGTYFGPSGGYGYNLVFNSDNTYTLYQVTTKMPQVISWTPPDNQYKLTQDDIKSQTLLSTSSVPANGVLFFEDNVWVSGDIRTRVTIASGRFIEPFTFTDIIINGNISYGGVKDGTRVLGAVAQGNILIPYSGAPNDLQMDGAYVAQNGRVGRRHYPQGTYRLRNSIVRYGMAASNLVPGTTWLYSNGTVWSGYQSGSVSYDPNLFYGPPPYFPTSGEYQFLSWLQKE